jgi:hypothetical protein
MAAIRGMLVLGLLPCKAGHTCFRGMHVHQLRFQADASRLAGVTLISRGFNKAVAPFGALRFHPATREPY